jgi:hypothetical protein
MKLNFCNTEKIQHISHCLWYLIDLLRICVTWFYFCPHLIVFSTLLTADGFEPSTLSTLYKEAPAQFCVRSPWLLLILPSFFLSFFLSLAPKPSLGPGPPPQNPADFLEASQQFSFLQGRVVSPTPNPHPGGPGLCIYTPRGRVASPF